jgi:hypothetical protein
MSYALVTSYAPLFVPIADQLGIQRSLVAGIMETESGGNNSPVAWGTGPCAARCVASVSGACGLMQVMPFHFTETEDPCDPATNIRVGCGVLRGTYDRCQGWDEAIAGYFGALDEHCVIREWADASGTTGPEYVAAVRRNQQMFLALDETEPPITSPISLPMLLGVSRLLVTA